MIVRYKPEEGLEEADMAWFDSDAPDNMTAVKEIDEEASKYGLVRHGNYWLQTLTVDGKVVRRGYCYRPPVTDRAERIAQRRGDKIVGQSSVDIVREMRDA